MNVLHTGMNMSISHIRIMGMVYIHILTISNKIISFNSSMSSFFLWKVPKIPVVNGKTSLTMLKYLYQSNKLYLNINFDYLLKFSTIF